MKKNIFGLLLMSLLFIAACDKDEEKPVVHSADGDYTIEYIAANANDDVYNMAVSYTDPDIELQYMRGNKSVSSLIGPVIIDEPSGSETWQVHLEEGENLYIHLNVSIENITVNDQCLGLSSSIKINGTTVDSEPNQCSNLAYIIKQ